MFLTCGRLLNSITKSHYLMCFVQTSPISWKLYFVNLQLGKTFVQIHLWINSVYTKLRHIQNSLEHLRWNIFMKIFNGCSMMDVSLISKYAAANVTSHKISENLTNFHCNGDIIFGAFLVRIFWYSNWIRWFTL